MPSINMIATRCADKKRLEGNMRRLMAIIIVFIGVGLALGGVFSLKIYSTRDRVNDLDVQLAKLQPTVTQISNYEKATSRLAPKLELLKDAKTNTLRWHSMLANLSQALPENTWLTRIATVNKTEPSSETSSSDAMTVNLNGMSVDQHQVGEAMLRLNDYPSFERVELHYTQKAMIGARQAVEFEVTAALKTEKKAKEATRDDSAKS